MLKISRTGSVADVIAQARDIPARVIPYAAAAALTRTAKSAQAAIVAELPRVFSGPTRYTLNSTRIVPATVADLNARVAVKDQVGSGTRPESFMLPGVFGGGRSEKRFERALRYAGILSAGQRAMPGADAPLDASGNLTAAFVRSVLRGLAKPAPADKSATKRRRAKPRAGTPFVSVNKGVPTGISRREGKSLKRLLVFTRAPVYRQRLDFAAIAEKTTRAEFEQQFLAAAASILAKRR